MRGKSRSRLLSLALVGGMALGATASSPELLALANPAASSSTMPQPSVSAASSATAAQSASQFGEVQPIGARAQQGVTDITSTRSLGFAASYSSWSPVPGHPSYGMRDFRGDPNSGSFGQCTWYAWYRHRWLPLMRLGNAGSWPANARRFGLRVSS